MRVSTTDMTGNDILDWITFDSGSGVFYGTPADKHVGTYNVVVEAEVGGDIATQSYELVLMTQRIIRR